MLQFVKCKYKFLLYKYGETKEKLQKMIVTATNVQRNQDFNILYLYSGKNNV